MRSASIHQVQFWFHDVKVAKSFGTVCFHIIALVQESTEVYTSDYSQRVSRSEEAEPEKEPEGCSYCNTQQPNAWARNEYSDTWTVKQWKTIKNIANFYIYCCCLCMCTLIISLIAASNDNELLDDAAFVQCGKYHVRLWFCITFPFVLD